MKKATGLVCLLIHLIAATARGQPNVLFILADDLGWTDLSGGATNFGFRSDFYETPNIDALARTGTAFTNAYAAGASCTPTRAAIMSGQYAPRPTNNLYTVSNLNRTNGQTVPLIGPEQGLPGGGSRLTGAAVTIAETLQTAQYVTANVGKWHIGTAVGSTSPAAQGFDYNFGGDGHGTPGQYHALQNGDQWEFSPNIGPELDVYASPYTAENAPEPSLIGTPKHITDAMTEAAIDFMETNKSRPFFVNFSHYAVHIPIDDAQARSDLLAKYKSKPPGSTGHNRAGYAALVEGIDQSVGGLIEYLTAADDPRQPGAKLIDNTLVVFYSDNGGVDGLTNNDPLKGGKQELTEGGIRVPMIASLPGRIAAGSVNHTPVTSVDLYTTFSALAGATLPEDYVLDGENLMPILEDETATLQRDALYWHFPGYRLFGQNIRPMSTIRKGNLKLTHYYEYAYDPATPEFELFDVGTDQFGNPNDIGETTDLAALLPDKVDELSTDLALWLWETGAKLPMDAETGLPVDYPGQRTADMNGDGHIDFDDIVPFVRGLNDAAGFQTEYGVPPELRGDANRNGRFDFDDIAPFVALLNGPAQSVPEPSSIVILLTTAIVILSCSRGRVRSRNKPVGA